MTAVLLGSLAVVASCALALLCVVVRGRNKHRLLAGSRGPSSDAPEGIGISVLCSGVTDLACIEKLLAVEYERYEVIVVLDSRLHPAEFAELRTRYRIIRVEYAPAQELPVHGVRALGRSRKRSFRRLVLLDRVQDTPAGDFDAAASVAAYDYMLPLCEGVSLLPGAVERLVAEVGEFPSGEVALVRTWLGEPLSLFGREAVVAAGGFACRPARHIPVRNRRILWEPLGTAARLRRRMPQGVKTLVALLLAGWIGFAAAAGRWPLAAALLTAALVWAAAACARQMLHEIAGTPVEGLFARKRSRRKFGVKNFTIS